MGAVVPSLPRDWGTDALAATFSRGGLPGLPGSANGPRPVHSGRLGRQRQVVHLTTRAQLDFMLRCGDRMAACALILSAMSILHTH